VFGEFNRVCEFNHVFSEFNHVSGEFNASGEFNRVLVSLSRAW
jgi:hypothetical protein